MRTALFLSGFVAAFCILLGMTMRILHWPGADYVLLTGDLSLIVSMGLLLRTSIQHAKQRRMSDLMGPLGGAIGGLMIGTGSFFKIMHWPGANILFVVGVGMVAFVFLPLFFLRLYKGDPAH
jgi:hypothetical protein